MQLYATDHITSVTAMLTAGVSALMLVVMMVTFNIGVIVKPAL